MDIKVNFTYTALGNKINPEISIQLRIKQFTVFQISLFSWLFLIWLSWLIDNKNVTQISCLSALFIWQIILQKLLRIKFLWTLRRLILQEASVKSMRTFLRFLGNPTTLKSNSGQTHHITICQVLLSIWTHRVSSMIQWVRMNFSRMIQRWWFNLYLRLQLMKQCRLFIQMNHSISHQISLITATENSHSMQQMAFWFFLKFSSRLSDMTKKRGSQPRRIATLTSHPTLFQSLSEYH